MRKKLYFFIPLLFLGLLLKADPVISDGNYYIREVNTDLYLSGGLSWGTCASLLREGDLVGITYDSSTDDYTLNYSSVLSVADTYMGIKASNDIYIDRKEAEGVSIKWAIQAVPDEVNKFYIVSLSYGMLCYSGSGQQAVFASYDGTPCVFQFIDPDNALTYLESSESGANATFLIDNPNFSRNKNFPGKWTGIITNHGGVNNLNYCVEQYRRIFDFSQTLTVFPGKYELSAQAFFRQDSELEGEDSYPEVYANKSTSPCIAKAGSENSLGDIATSFANGLYYISPITVDVPTGELKIGIRVNNAKFWVGYDGFSLQYKGPVTIPDKTVDIGPSGYATFYSSQPSDYIIQDAQDTEVYLVETISGEGSVRSMKLEYYSDSTIPFNTAVIIKGAPNTQYTLKANSEKTASVSSVLLGCEEETSQDPNNDYFTLDVKDGSLLFGKYDSTKQLKANKAYYKQSKQSK